jgi:deoxyribodipyrimidine photolyase-like uncharacterized protein
MLAYSRTTGYRHDSIPAGKQLLAEVGAEQGFEIKFTETNEDITLEGLSQYEVVFFMNTTGDVFNQTEQEAFEEWMTTKRRRVRRRALGHRHRERLGLLFRGDRPVL